MSTTVATGASVEAIQHHYDLSNDFYALWLDPSMTYSSALWYGDESLSSAQRNKLDWHLDRVQIDTAERLLDVGCGWGSLLHRATERNPRCHGVGLSLSAAQLAAIAEHHWPRIETRLESWADHEADAPYDGIVSIGAFEHFARLDQSPREKLEGYRAFFVFCHRVSKPRGPLSLQTITYETADREQFSRFFAERIFPESDLPHLHEIAQAAHGLFEIVELRNDRAHYARTLRHWLSALRAHKDEAIALVGERAYIDYERYLGLMVVAFHTGTMNLCRLALRRLDPPGVLA
ncbi:class I SAM-dependent methyltransferase [Chitinimonas lacunae]|uniref:Class I SAM-dependent methyltransferase n=1 Tax=Chitinimonas lacunae TaxID=1963018 RepID=A0ABV8MUL9_9NEIS